MAIPLTYEFNCKDTLPSEVLRILSSLHPFLQQIVHLHFQILPITICQGTVIQFWCSCHSNNEAHCEVSKVQRVKSSEMFQLPHENHSGRGQVSGHVFVHLKGTGAYKWCKDYFSSKNRNINYKNNPPNCPAGAITFERSTTIFTRLCSLCESNGCPLKRELRSLYGRRSAGERLQFLAEQAKKARQASQE
ncbi:hypothetical protein QBC43DRAFT_330688 [Cladorrhinum sp. PSN259]|nr:hypothetical protein QBC43DRAFT_330688 [Cladorrhinum sp. PSN259]